MKSIFTILILALFSSLLSCTSEKADQTYKGNTNITPSIDSVNQPLQQEKLQEPIVYKEIDSVPFSFLDYIAFFRSPGITPVQPIYSNTDYVLNSIPDFVAKKYIESSHGYNTRCFYFAKELLVDGPFYVLIYVRYVEAGPGIDQLRVETLDKNGLVISNLTLGENYPSSGPDGSGQECTYEYNNQLNVLKVKKVFTDHNEETEQTEISELTNFYQLDEYGNLIPGRKYPETSERILASEELKQYPVDELKLMRNEIFATHGYIFKTEPFKSYFNNMKWYEPLYNEVDDQLTTIEKENIKLIRSFEK